MNVLIIKLSPITALNSSTLRSVGTAKSFVTKGYVVDYLTTPMNEVLVQNKDLDLQGINIIEINKKLFYHNLIHRSKNNMVLV